VAQRLDRLDLGWVVFVLAALALLTVVAAVRWQYIVVKCGAPITFKSAYYYTMVGWFFNQTLPSTVGGDAARVYLLARGGAGWRIASYSVLVDRGIGLFFLVILVAICLPWSLVLIKDQVGRIALTTIAIGGIAAALGFAALALVPEALADRWWVTRHVAGVAKVLLQLCRSTRTAFTISALSILIHLLTVVAAWGAAKSFAAPLSLADALILVPPVMLISIIPISIAGWGVREGLMVVAFGYAGLPQSDGLMVSLLIGFAMFIVGIFGAIWWVLTGHRLSGLPEEPTVASSIRARDLP
jgi:glycosyltransferase 2 family protein